MKPPPFVYHRPASVVAALATLAEAGEDGKVLAGGQSLVPLLNMRLTQPGHLVDINRIRELSYVDAGSDAVRVGALTRHAELARHPGVPALLREATGCVAHPAIRNRGTTVGSIVHADPAAELPAVLALLRGSVTLASAAARPGRARPDQEIVRRSVAAADFFLGPLTSAVRPDELAVEAVFPRPAPRSGTAWLELSRRKGDFALCGTGVLVTLDEDRRVTGATGAYTGVGPVPVLVELTEAVAGRPVDAVDWDRAGTLAAGAVAPEDDIHATAAYRRQLVRVLSARAGAAAARMAVADG
ncbi:MAG: FAD binding domain-containing protein [Micromonosporaceae bacterium]|nr:FAD binding domain-containing protein [Micromonosporaceae bacterium]